ncbi:lactose-binding lectin l-2 [Labrus bergylta]|uniref:Lactose-binding lectin l-2-like n=1 Tax=Labrus bergylta TaxID=56723 RepID=A0A3Q3GQ50_9LABR|nr:lactose-binding lectin l-2-like [Labrus bergylta]
MQLFLFLFALALGAVSPSDQDQTRLQRAGCPMFWYNFNGRCYKYISTPTTWADAELYCLSLRANLVSIHSLEEKNFVKLLIKNYDHSERWTWIGLSDIHKEGNWMWSDGCQAKYFFWASGQPDNANGEHCVHYNLGIDLKWNDLPCSHLAPSVCASRINCP